MKSPGGGGKGNKMAWGVVPLGTLGEDDPSWKYIEERGLSGSSLQEPISPHSDEQGIPGAPEPATGG